ncbi:RRS1-like protein [Mya arenaria]|uniref:Ribosome biogenesis regulatory protein n=1 Tax=Mya arenaria TaxID=6604 RepID=A0ABY7DLJ1_MYAAR|nr:RRS1-like protein [Mya arenaria]
MADIVENVLREAAEKEAKYKTTEVIKDIDLDIDAGNLFTYDSNPFDSKKTRSNREAFLKDLARDNTQLLINKIWQLPTERIENVVVAQLPGPSTPIPREKPVPKPKPETKWEKYAKIKGIQNKKKSRMVWDEESKTYKPRWGYKRGRDETKSFALVVPQNVDPYEDQFAKKMSEKKERDYLSKALAVAKTSTASIGKFTDKLPKEKAPKNMGKKRKSNHGDIKTEMTRQMDILNNLHSGRPIVDKTKAANMQNRDWESERSKRRREDPELHRKKPKGKRSNQGKKGNLRNFKGGKKGRGGGGGGRGGKS